MTTIPSTPIQSPRSSASRSWRTSSPSVVAGRDQLDLRRSRRAGRRSRGRRGGAGRRRARRRRPARRSRRRARGRRSARGSRRRCGRGRSGPGRASTPRSRIASSLASRWARSSWRKREPSPSPASSPCVSSSAPNSSPPVALPGPHSDRIRKWPRGNLDAVVAQAKIDRKRLDSAAIGPFSLTAIGIASVVGAGIFVTIGEASAQLRRPRRDLLLHARRDRRRGHRPLLRRARGDGPGRRLDLLVRLRRLRVVPRLVHRLGPAARVPVRGLDRGGRLVRLLRQLPRQHRDLGPARPRQPAVRRRHRRSSTCRRSRSSSRPARCSISAPASRPARTTRWWR